MEMENKKTKHPPRVIVWKPNSCALPEYCGWKKGGDHAESIRGSKEYLALSEHQAILAASEEARKVMREALRFYATVKHNQRSHPENYSTDLEWDDGAKAREALASEKGEK